ncbi:MAG: tetratricopeptide repeat protein [Methylacidiphilales bacterium]|nr:tetratricopeptide repeat protein [Candidatus Methylacidiphilales bacterium]
MKLTKACLLVTASLLPFSTFWLRAADTDSDQASTAQEAAQMEAVKRQQLTFSANQAISDGQRLLGSGNYDDAATRFQYAVDALTGGPATIPYHRAVAGLAAAKAGQAQLRAKDAKFAEAATLLQQAIELQPDNPAYPQALDDLKQQQIAYEAQVRDPEGTINNPAVTDEFKDRVATVQKLLFQGDAYFRTGQYDRAEETYSKALILDPYNNAARNKMDHVEHYLERAAEFRHDQYEKSSLIKVNQGWEDAISPDIVAPPVQSGTQIGPSNRVNIMHKLESIIIDKVNFDKLDIATVIQFLTQKSKELDPDHQGINFVLRLTSNTPPPTDTTTPTGATPDNSGGGAAAPATGGATDATGGGAAGGGAGGGGATDQTAAPQTIHRQVSINLENVPLKDLLGYIIAQTNLQFSVEDYAVYLRPSIDEGETLSVRTYLVPPSFFSGSTLRVTPTTDTSTPTTVESLSVPVQQELTDKGIRFPPGATATFLPGSSKLVVRNTPEQLDLIANLIDQLTVEQPQIQIEAKVAEFNQSALKGLTFNYLAGNNTSLSPDNNFVAQTALRTSAYTTPTGTGGLTPNGIDTLIQENSATDETFPISSIAYAPNIPNTLYLGAIIDGTGFQALIEAINNIQGVSLLSAPTVTTQNNLKANIDIVREFPYPTSFEKPKLSSSSNIAYSDGPAANLPLILAIPPTPREFVTQDVGVSLEVKPTTYPDQRIDLNITKAQVLDFDGFINYGVPIIARLSEAGPNEILTPGIINQPVFNLRSVVTDLQVLDGQTAVLGGLIREDTQEINDKVPVLGDLPLVGRLFQSKISERTKKSLLIFITARLIRSNGKPQYMQTLEAEPQEEKLPEPEPLSPGVTLPPLPEGEPNS